MRSYTIQSTKYIIKNFLYLLPFAVLPAFFLSLSLAKEEISCVLTAVFSGALTELRFEHLFNAVSVLNFSSWESVISGAVGFIVLIACVAVVMAILEKHMRIGKRSFRGILSKLNDNLQPTLLYAFVVLVVYELWSLLTATFVLLLSKIPVLWLAYTLIGALFIAAHIALVYLLGLLYLWLPCMQITGFRTMEAFQYSYHLMAPVRWAILAVQTLMLVAVEWLICACALFIADGFVFALVTTIVYTVLIMFYCVRMEIAYFDRENMQRADEKRYYW